MLAKNIFAFVLISLMTETVLGQNLEVHGKVVDASGKGVEGANIFVYSKSVAMQTDSLGIFHLHNIDINDRLLFSRIGFKDTAVTVKNTDYLIVSLRKQEHIIDAVEVNTGYEKIPRERSVGSFERIGNAQLDNVISLNILDKLEGQSSLLFDKEEGRPAITVRGINTIEGNTQPLIILDNFPYEGAINSINPIDVDNITILRDASASSIWGARASNGVIVISTKKGRKDKGASLHFSSTAQIGEKPRLNYLNQISSKSLVELEREMFNQGVFDSYFDSPQKPWLSPVVDMLFKNRNGTIDNQVMENELEKLSGIDNRAQYRDLMYAHSVYQQYHLSLAKGWDHSRLYLSVGYDKDRSVLSQKFHRYNARINYGYSGIPKLSWDNSLYLNLSKEENGHNGYPRQDYHNRPYLNLVDENGEEILHYAVNKEYAIDMYEKGLLLDWGRYPLREQDLDKKTNANVGLIASSGLKYRLFDWLDFSILYNLELENVRGLELHRADSYYARNLINNFTQMNGDVITRSIPLGAIKYDDLTNSITHNWRGQVNINTTWGNHSVHGLGGFEIRKRKRSQLQSGVYGYDEETMTSGLVDYVDPTPHLLLGSDQYVPDPNKQVQRRDNFVSGFVNIGYDFQSKYLVTISARKDASNNFGMATNDRWNPMWSAGIGWNLNKEAFLSKAWFDVLKIRSTYGVTGNMDPSKSAVTVISFLGQDPLSQSPRAVVNQKANNKLKWETTKTLNFGVDFTKSSVSGYVEFYKKWNENLFAPALNDLSNGGDVYIIKNVGSMSANGIEANIDIKWKNSTDFSFSSRFMYNYNASTVTSYLENSDRSSRNNTNDGINLLRIREGLPLYPMISYPFIRLNSEGQMVSSLDGQETTLYEEVLNADMDNLVYSGSARPLHFGNMSLDFRYKRFDLGMLFNWKAKYVFRRPTVRYGMLFNQQPLGMGPGSGDYEKRWKAAGDEQYTTVPKFEYPISESDNIYRLSDVTVIDGTHLRMQTVNIGYTFSQKKNGVFSNARVGANITNIGIIWRKGPRDIDPDFPNSLPLPRTYAINIQLDL